MREYFKNGGAHLESDEAFNECTVKNNTVGYGPSAYDTKGSCYWADKNNMDPIWQYHDSNIAEYELGFKSGSLNGQIRYRVDCDDLSPHNQRIASGREPGANQNFTGIVVDADGNKTIDPKVYNQRTSGGQPECVTDQMPLSVCKVSGPQKFDDPNELTNTQCETANKISCMPDGDAKRNKVNCWNAEADALRDRMSGEQDYLKSRINDHEKRMSEFPESSLEYNRAKDNRNDCQNYYDKLSASKDKLQAKQDEINNSTHQTSDHPFNPTDHIPKHTGNSTSNGMGTGMGIG